MNLEVAGQAGTFIQNLISNRSLFSSGDPNASTDTYSAAPPKAPAKVSTSGASAIQQNDEAIDLARYKQAAEELENGSRDDALGIRHLLMVGAKKPGPKPPTFVLRVEQLRRSAVAASATRATATQPALVAQPVQQTIIPKARTITAPKNAKKSVYEVLQVTPTADQDAIKAAYNSRIAQFYPVGSQRNPDDALFKILTEAYETLSDPAKRADYDAALKRSATIEADAVASNQAASRPEQDFIESDAGKAWATDGQGYATAASREYDETPRPWIRYWAKIFDLILFTFVFIFILSSSSPLRVVLGLLILVLGFPLYESVMFTLFGDHIRQSLIQSKTPARWLEKIFLRSILASCISGLSCAG